MAGEPQFGPEIELRGKKHALGALCQVGHSAGAAVVGGGIVGAVYEGLAKNSLDDLPIYLAAGSLGFVTMIGCEFALENDPQVTHSYLKQIYARLEERQRKGELKLSWGDTSWSRPALRVEYSNGRTIIFSTDPNVVEVKLPPIAPKDLADNLEFYQKEIYETARGVGLKAPRLDGPWNGGHLHIDIAKAFDSDPTKLKNFLLDYIEHPELASGVMVRDFYNAPAIDPLKQRSAIELVVHQLDLWAEKGKKLDDFDLIELAKIGPFSKRDALNLNTVNGTLEIRGLRSQKSAAELLKVMKLLAARIKYTNGLPSKVFAPKSIRLSRREKAAAFRGYVEEAGLDYEEYKGLAPSRFRIPKNCREGFAQLK